MSDIAKQYNISDGTEIEPVEDLELEKVGGAPGAIEEVGSSMDAEIGADGTE